MGWGWMLYLLFPVLCIVAIMGFIATAWTYFETKQFSRIGVIITLTPVLIYIAILIFLQAIH